MSDYLSPEQEDPEKRIRELERGLADTRHPAPQQPPQFPQYGVNPVAGSMPTWSHAPVPPAAATTPPIPPVRCHPRRGIDADVVPRPGPTRLSERAAGQPEAPRA